ncbi:MAG: iron-binding protein [Cereibacter sphaeroides]|uniref:Iron-binding protein n=1 Tax=Cereibacter sphaeroides TaxID=1063 RepID=A0A2W5SCZ6_CERSP|nr:MAG: iron-binding protein [Cereibacter sphaeroides]
MVEIVEGREVTVTFDGKRCVHSRNCVLGHPEVFVPNVKGDWIFPDTASAATGVHIGLSCPSGAIRVARKDGRPGSEVAPIVNTIRLRENGPLALEAEMIISGAPGDSVRATLCRCGASRNKPFCDGSHAEAGFTASGEAEPKPSEPLAARDGTVAVEPQPNGPLKLSGNLEIVSGTGHTLNRVTQTWLCRCGHSKNKPYCDGSHKAAGFVAD